MTTTMLVEDATRREFLVAAALLPAACGDGGGDSATAPTTTTAGPRSVRHLRGTAEPTGRLERVARIEGRTVSYIPAGKDGMFRIDGLFGFGGGILHEVGFIRPQAQLDALVAAPAAFPVAAEVSLERILAKLP